MSKDFIQCSPLTTAADTLPPVALAADGSHCFKLVSLGRITLNFRQKMELGGEKRGKEAMKLDEVSGRHENSNFLAIVVIP